MFNLMGRLQAMLIHTNSSLLSGVRLLLALAVIASAPIIDTAGPWSHTRSLDKLSASQITDPIWPQVVRDKSDEYFLEDLSQRSFRFFWENADPTTGLERDRARSDGSPHDADHSTSERLAWTGFGMTALSS